MNISKIGVVLQAIAGCAGAFITVMLFSDFSETGEGTQAILTAVCAIGTILVFLSALGKTKGFYAGAAWVLIFILSAVFVASFGYQPLFAVFCGTVTLCAGIGHILRRQPAKAVASPSFLQSTGGKNTFRVLSAALSGLAACVAVGLLIQIFSMDFRQLPTLMLIVVLASLVVVLASGAATWAVFVQHKHAVALVSVGCIASIIAAVAGTESFYDRRLLWLGIDFLFSMSKIVGACGLAAMVTFFMSRRQTESLSTVMDPEG